LKAARRLLESSRTPRGHVRAAARGEVVRVVERAHASGMAYSAICEVLGVEEARVHRWRWQERSSRSALVAVQVAEAAQVAGLIVHGPRGLRIEGLSVRELAELLRGLS
jgi:transposase